MLKKALPKTSSSNVCHFDRVQKCLHTYLRISGCCSKLNINDVNEAVAHRQNTESTKVILNKNYHVHTCQYNNGASNYGMNECYTGVLKTKGSNLTTLKDVGARCIKQLTWHLLQFQCWKSDYVMAPTLGSYQYQGSGGRNRDLKRFLEEVSVQH